MYEQMAKERAKKLGVLIDLLNNYDPSHRKRRIEESYKYLNAALTAGQEEAIDKFDNFLSNLKEQLKRYGSSNPVSNNNTEEGRKTNRRVEFIITRQ